MCWLDMPFSYTYCSIPIQVKVIGSCRDGINKLVESLHQKFPNVSKSQLKNKVREISEFVDNRWQVRYFHIQERHTNNVCFCASVIYSSALWEMKYTWNALLSYFFLSLQVKKEVLSKLGLSSSPGTVPHIHLSVGILPPLSSSETLLTISLVFFSEFQKAQEHSDILLQAVSTSGGGHPGFTWAAPEVENHSKRQWWHWYSSNQSAPLVPVGSWKHLQYTQISRYLSNNGLQQQGYCIATPFCNISLTKELEMCYITCDGCSFCCVRPLPFDMYLSGSDGD